MGLKDSSEALVRQARRLDTRLNMPHKHQWWSTEAVGTFDFDGDVDFEALDAIEGDDW